MTQVKNMGVRVPPDTHRKLCCIAQDERRTINGHVLYQVGW